MATKDARHLDDVPAKSGGAAGPGGVTPSSFEAAAERLGEIVQRLEHGDLPLEASIELFEEGVRVARAAQTRLDQAERRVEELLGIDEHGEAETREIE